MTYYMYICPECRSYFKTGSRGKKIKCYKCKTDYLTDLDITDADWRELEEEERTLRINQSIMRDWADRYLPQDDSHPVEKAASAIDDAENNTVFDEPPMQRLERINKKPFIYAAVAAVILCVVFVSARWS